MKKFKKLFVYIFISVLVTLFVSNIWFKIDSGYFNYFAIAITNSEEEILVDDFFAKTLALKEDFAEDEYMATSFKESYDRYYSLIPDDVENKEAYLLAFILNVISPTMEILQVKYEMQYYTQAFIAGLILGILIYLIINISFKFSWLKLLLGFVIFIAIIFLAGGLIIGIENVIHFHLLKYIVWSIIAYALLIGLNLISQKIKISKLNKNLNISNEN